MVLEPDVSGVSGQKAGTCRPVFLAALLGWSVPGSVLAETTPPGQHPCLEKVAGKAVAVARGAEEGLFQDEDGMSYRLADVGFPAGTGTPDRTGEEGDSYFAYPAGPQDRWGIVPAWIVSPKQGGSVLLQETLLEQGDAIAVPDLGNLSCALKLKRAEAHARLKERNLWRAQTIHTSRHPDRLLERIGHYVLVEGRVVSLGKTSRTRYLNFGYRWKRDFTVTIQAADEAGFEELLALSGSSLGELDGSTVRVRGYLQAWDGPHIRLEHAGQLDVIDWKRTGRDAQPRTQ